MSLGFELVKLGDYINITSGFAFKSKDFLDEGIPVIKIKNIVPPYVLIDDAQFVSEKFLIEKKNYVLKKGDVLITLTGSNVNQMASAVGQVARIQFNEPSLLNQRVAKITVKDEKCCNINYIYYILSTDEMHYNLASRASGSANQANISPDTIREMEIILPPIDIQNKIVDILNKMDEKIILNEKINHNLEQCLKLYFNEYFLEYEFNEFSNSNKSIPDSWTLGNFNEVINTLGSGDWGKDELIDNYTSEVYCIRGADIPDVKLGNKGKMPIRFILPKNFENKKLDENSIVIEISGGSPTQSTGRTVFITKDFLNRFDKDIICTNFCKVIKPKENYEIFLYLYLNHLYDKDVMFAYENGTTGIKNFDIKSFINNFLIVIPSEEDIIKFNNTVKDVFDIIMHNGLEIEKLVNLRDTLLPKLMSGELDVSKINCDLKLIIKKFILKIINYLEDLI